MKRILISTLFLFLFFYSGLAAMGLCSEKLEMGYFVLPPHQIPQPSAAHGPTGAAITYFEIIAEKAGYKVNWTRMPLLRLTANLKMGKLDGSVNFPKFPMFQSFMYFSQKPIYSGQPVFAVKKEFPLTEIRSIEDLKGLHIGVGRSKSDRYIPMIDQNRDKIVLERTPDMDWLELNFAHLVNGRLDAVFDRQQYSIQYVVKRLNMEDRIRIINAPAPIMPFYIVFSKAQAKTPAICRKIDQVMERTCPDYDELLTRQFDLIK